MNEFVSLEIERKRKKNWRNRNWLLERCEVSSSKKNIGKHAYSHHAQMSLTFLSILITLIDGLGSDIKIKS